MTLAGIARDAAQTADDLRTTIIASALDDASYAIKRDALVIAERVTGGDRRLSRFGSARTRGRTRMGVRYDIAGTRSVILLKPAAMWAMTTHRVRPHQIGAGRRTRTGSRTRARRGRVVLAFDTPATPARGGPATRVRVGPVRHPGTGPQGSIDVVYRRVDQHVADTFGDAIRRSLASWDGR